MKYYGPYHLQTPGRVGTNAFTQAGGKQLKLTEE